MAGVSVATVSRMLNNRGYISEATREKIKKCMVDLDYKPNELARSLTKRRTNIIGIIVPNVNNQFFSKLVYFLERYAFKRNFKILLCNSKSQLEKEKEYIDMLRSNQVSAMIIASRNSDIENYLDESMPVVFIERKSKNFGVNICCDNELGGELATRHLIESGCKNLLHISGQIEKDLPGDLRAISFERICKENNINYNIVSSTEHQFYKGSYGKLIENIFTNNKYIDGIFASNDTIAAQIIQYCYKKGLRVPKDIKIVGFDDVEIASLTTPTITTIKQPIKEMAEIAIESIEKMMDKKIVASHVVLPVELKKRNST